MFTKMEKRRRAIMKKAMKLNFNHTNEIEQPNQTNTHSNTNKKKTLKICTVHKHTNREKVSETDFVT